MSLFDQIAGSLLAQGGEGKGGVPALLASVLGQQPGGLPGLVEKFQGAGLGDVVGSWVGTGANQPISPELLQGVLGSEVVQGLAARTGLPVDQLLAQAAQHLPGIVDQLTPNGEVPGRDGLLAAGLGLLNRLRG